MTKQEYILCLGDGMADIRLAELQNKTPLEAAKTPVMDWLAAHQANSDCCCKTILCVDDIGGQVELLGVQRPVSLRMISANQLK